MAAVAMAHKPNYRPAFERFTKRRNEPDFLRQARQDSFARFERLGIPNIHQEAWRFTDLSGWAGTTFASAGPAPMDAAHLPPALDGPRLVFINGQINVALSRLAALPKGTVVTNLAAAIASQPALIESHWERVPGLGDHPFAALNSAFMVDGAFVYLAPGAALEQPIQLVFHASGDGIAHYPRNLIVLGEAAQATIVEQYSGAGAYFACPLSEIALDDGTVLAHHKLQWEDARAQHLGGLRLVQKGNSNTALHFLTAGGLLNRSDIVARLAGAGADCTLTGLTLVEDGQLGDYHVRVEHTEPHGRSRQTFKTVLDGKSRAVFDGLIHVAKDAQKTDAGQLNRNLLLTKRAAVHANPRLEIHADDVKCSHGSTTGFLDPDALFYLRSRGISQARARALLIHAFAKEQIETIRVAALREHLEELLVSRFHPDD
ncbi:MAG: Fe-S cluster assembly protein SufD [Gammaproteobacteria bacterium]